MPNYIQRALHPDWYHGHRKRPPFFEGWYFKFIDPTEARRYAVIPGIFLSDEPEKHHAFVQVLDGQTGASAYFTYPPEQFAAAADAFDVHVGPNHFRADGIALDLSGPELALRGELSFDGLTPWPVTLASPGIMGWYGWLPFMECYHGVVSLDHSVRGTLRLNGEQMDFTGGRGYIEKDWGQSFPSAWVWTQTNHFERFGTSLTASIAVIPSLGRAFPGFIVGLWHGGRLYRFATYTGAKVEKLTVTEREVEWVMRGGHRLELYAARSGGGLLRGPSRVEMHKRVMETLSSTVEVRLSSLSGGRTVRELFRGTGRHAGLEVQGDLSMLVK
jgi:tocopherol cyclase